MTEKTVNYTDAMVARLHAVYDGEAPEAERDEQIEDLSAELGRSKPSIRAKLTREGIYVAKAKAPAGKAGVTKAVLVAAIAHTLEVPEEVVESLEKANKAALVRVLTALRS